jgi:hypothetical protein
MQGKIESGMQTVPRKTKSSPLRRVGKWLTQTQEGVLFLAVIVLSGCWRSSVRCF